MTEPLVALHDVAVSSLGNPGPNDPRGPAQPPAAARSAAQGWRDPRLWVGVLIVAASVVAGARLLASADDTVPVWAVADELGPGDDVTADDLTARRVRFADAADLDRYFRASDDLPADVELTRGVGAGELLPRGAVTPAGESGTVQVRIAMSDEHVPASVDTGSTIHVHLRSGSGARGRGAGRGEPVLEGVTVVAAPPAAENLASTGNRTVDVAVTEEQAHAYLAALAKVDDPVLTVVKVG